ncbi:transposase, OrfB family (plasmid) [Borreliella bissettiae DN127]|uniref:Transposase, OrfB family n=1 Tax=Borrelia bissettiae (strain DSM 17990 / CIP 109136 / DN127) TaxID=521010 RepID=G0ANZ2_BORBD|nr:hypothetical protein [Borreliella bissettiae]AEL19418.1 transposase, OrfB family [Borreliella bissettiae DN127]WKD00300.1 hypothetical protein QIA02_04470 [Borreliella bissettiae]
MKKQEKLWLKLPKIEFLSLLCLHNINKGNEIIKNVVVEKDTNNKYYILLSVESIKIIILNIC